MTNRHLLAVDDLRVHYQIARPHLFGARPTLRAVDGVSLTVERGRTLGCRFHTRCAHAGERCRVEVPKLVEKASGHWEACHFDTSTRAG